MTELKSIENWNSFEKYPEQGEAVCIHCFTEDGSKHRYVDIKFDATTFKPEMIHQNIFGTDVLQYEWLPLKLVESYD